ncbi:MAG TPA: acyl-CoA desaturase [Kofleriaceae bacterium]
MVAIVGVVRLGVAWPGVALAMVLYAIRMFAVTAGLHRYFAHRSFETSRAMQFALGVVATLACQQGVLWWTSQHRVHHRCADTEHDPHAGSFWWSHVGWFLVHTHDETQWHQIADLSGYRELRWLDRHYFIPVALFIAVLWFAGGVSAVVWGFCVSTVLLWHATFSLTSIAHRFGSRRYRTDDQSRNHPVVALLTLGDGWHNNHHHYPRSVRHGFYAWEMDPTYLGIRVLAALGLVWNLHVVPERVRARRLIEVETCRTPIVV